MTVPPRSFDASFRPTRRRLRAAGAAAFVSVVALLLSSCVLSGSWLATTPAALAETPDSFVEVSCPTAEFCMAVGNSDIGGFYNLSPFVQTWDGSAWTSVPFDSGADEWPPEIDFHMVSALDVTCASPTRCIFVTAWDVGDDISKRFSAWDGSDFTYLPSPSFEWPTQASCAADGGCVLAGIDGTVTWDGTTPVTHEGGPALEALTCLTADSCIGVYGDGSDYSYRWDGASWTGMAPIPTGGDWLGFSSISCSAADRCLTVGRSLQVSAEPVAYLWDGVTWTSTPLPITGPAELESVSCAGPLACVAVGTATSGDPASTGSVALGWNGLQWFVAPTPPGAPTAEYSGVSCPPPSTCMAVGGVASGGTPELLASAYAWE